MQICRPSNSEIICRARPGYRIATVALVSVVLSFAAPGIPSGGLFVLAPIYMAIGIPVEGIYSIKSGDDRVTGPGVAVLREPVHAESV